MRENPIIYSVQFSNSFFEQSIEFESFSSGDMLQLYQWFRYLFGEYGRVGIASRLVLEHIVM